VSRGLARVILRQHLLQQRLGGAVRQGARFESRAVPVARNLPHQMLDKYLDGVLRALRGKDTAALRIELVLREQVRHQRKR
jgi:hypothetical protein